MRPPHPMPGLRTAATILDSCCRAPRPSVPVTMWIPCGLMGSGRHFSTWPLT